MCIFTIVLCLLVNLEFLSAATILFTTLGFTVYTEPDPDVPMLMKNLNPQNI